MYLGTHKTTVTGNVVPHRHNVQQVDVVSHLHAGEAHAGLCLQPLRRFTVPEHMHTRGMGEDGEGKGARQGQMSSKTRPAPGGRLSPRVHEVARDESDEIATAVHEPLLLLCAR